ncbi:D-methionine transport system ATP-binding protein [Seinonella peptonophila]|uniref:D-methionine transport system ATP-binding protein n=1 Tax=Seinonella peptonophila TaxID=112248 RepID=A0A1M4U3V8_9BACL|nr:ATP-binding cassette domain-containing protein [Seinonella peptonophila]SHE51326.1 D-methionine transport system ATP-binding protein [Seinonella peptonophila]
MIQFHHVSKRYEDKQKSTIAVDRVSLAIPEGTIYGIIGFSGAGKSTLLRMINGLEKPSEGQVFVADQEISQLADTQLRSRRQKMGMIFQHFHLLWSRTVRENIAFPLEIADVDPATLNKKVDYLLERVGLTEKADDYPSQLSGGQKQRVGIARALANDPSVLLCDEATSALDPETTRSILKLLQEINQELGITLVIVTHEMSVVQSICRQMSVMDHGKVIEEGTVEELFSNPKHPITKRLVTNELKSVDHVEEVLSIHLYDLRNWNSIQQLISRHPVHLQILPGNLNVHQPVISFRVQGKSEDITAVKSILQSANEEGLSC